MARFAILAFITFVGASAVQGGAVVSLIPENPGPYSGGETFDVGLWLSQDSGGSDIYLRGIRFDFNASDPAIALNSFAWNTSSTYFCQELGLCEQIPFIAEFPRLDDADRAVVNLVYLGGQQRYLDQVILPEIGALLVGHLRISLPVVTGQYDLDAMNAETADGTNVGAGVDFGFEHRTIWIPDNGLSGGQYTFVVVPEPATLMLLGLGGVAATMRRRTA